MRSAIMLSSFTPRIKTAVIIYLFRNNAFFIYPQTSIMIRTAVIFYLKSLSSIQLGSLFRHFSTTLSAWSLVRFVFCFIPYSQRLTPVRSVFLLSSITPALNPQFVPCFPSFHNPSFLTSSSRSLIELNQPPLLLTISLLPNSAF